MLYDIKDRLIIDDYLPTIEVLKNFYKKSHIAFCEEIGKIQSPLRDKLEELKLQHQNDSFYCVRDEEVSIQLEYLDDLIYHHLSSCLQSIVSLWEIQMNDFYLLKQCTNYNILKKHFLKDNYYDLDSDTKIDEIRQVNNYLKHGEFGDAEKKLKKMKSRYYNNNGLNGEVRSNYFRSKLLNISISDIEYFANTFIDFWNQVLTKLN